MTATKSHILTTWVSCKIPTSSDHSATSLVNLCAALFTALTFPCRAWRQHNKHADWVWRQQRGKQGLLVIDGYRFLEENRLTEHAFVWQRSALHSSEENSSTLNQSCLLHFSHVILNILLLSSMWKTHSYAHGHATIPLWKTTAVIQTSQENYESPNE